MQVVFSEMSKAALTRLLYADATEKEFEEVQKMFAELILRNKLEAAYAADAADLALKNDVQILEQQIKDKNNAVNFLSFGVGAAGLNLNSSGALRLFKEYSQKHNFYLGSTVHEGESSGSKESVLAAVQRNFTFALKTKKHFVLYYHGHGHNDPAIRGDWCLPGGLLGFAELSALLSATRASIEPESQIVVYLICDCCYSGHWVELWKTLPLEQRSLLRVFASSAHNLPCYDGVFPKIFFKEARVFSDDEVDLMNCTDVHAENVKRMFPNDLNAAKTIHLAHYKLKGSGHSIIGATNKHCVGCTSYTKTELIKKGVKEGKHILKQLLHNEWASAMSAFLSVNPRYCSYEIGQHEHQFNWCSDGIMEKWYDSFCAELRRT